MNRKRQNKLGPGWFEERPIPEMSAPRHREAAIKGHRRVVRGIPGEHSTGHPGKPSSAEIKAADLVRENAMRKDLDQSPVSVGAAGVQYEAFREPAAKKPPGMAKPVNAPLGIDRGKEIENPHGKGGRYHCHDDPDKPPDWHYDKVDPHPEEKKLDAGAMAGHMAHDVFKIPKPRGGSK